MTKDIELQDSFSEYATNELVKKLHEIDPEDYTDYFKDILYICGRFGYADVKPMNLNASKLLLMAMEHAFGSLLQYFAHMIKVAGLKFDRAGLDTIAEFILDMYPAKLEDLIFYEN